MTKRKRKKQKRHCVDCGAVLKDGYWRRCKLCWKNYENDVEDDSENIYSLNYIDGELNFK